MSKRPAFTAAAIEQAMSTAIDRKLEIAEEKTIQPLCKSVIAFLNCKTPELQQKLLDDALQAIELFHIREVQLGARQEEISIDSKLFIEESSHISTESKSNVLNGFHASKQQLVDAQQDRQYRSECAHLASDLATMQPREALEASTAEAAEELKTLSTTSELHEINFNKRMMKLDYIMSTALELKS